MPKNKKDILQILSIMGGSIIILGFVVTLIGSAITVNNRSKDNEVRSVDNETSIEEMNGHLGDIKAKQDVFQSKQENLDRNIEHIMKWTIPKWALKEIKKENNKKDVEEIGEGSIIE